MLPKTRRVVCKRRHFMPDLTLEIQKAAPQKLAALLELVMAPGGAWQVEELHAILEYQLSNPLQFQAEEAPSTSQPREENGGGDGPRVKTLQELFEHPAAPLELLRQVKDFAKAHMEHPASAWPSEVARLIYYTAIAVAWARHRNRISQMSFQEIERAFQWTLEQSWITPAIRQVVREASISLPPVSGESGQAQPA